MSPCPQVTRALAAGGVRYSQVWEDHRLLEEGLAVAPGDDLLSITGAGCNVLNLLLLGPRSVTAVDLNPAQGALLELKVAAFRGLSYDGLVAFLGLRPSRDRLASYRRLRRALPPGTRTFWDARPGEVAAGVAGCGRLERYFRGFRRQHLGRLVEPGALDTLLDLDDPQAQRQLFRQRIASPAFRRTFRWYFGRQMMARRGRHAAQFRYLNGVDVGAFFLQRFTYGCTRLPARDNCYLEYFLTAAYRRLERAPPYLRRGNFKRLRSLLDRLTVVTGEIEGHLEAEPAGTYSKVNLSDSWEYLSPAEYQGLLSTVATRLRPGGRAAYWNLLVPHRSPPCLAGRLRSHRELARALTRRDRAWFYRAFRIEEVLG